MKTIYSIAITTLLTVSSMFAQDVTTVRATNSDISDNLDLRAVASIFGDSKDLEDFERKLNDPEVQISNLDLNRDGRVDYLRVIEAVESNTHLIILQSVLGADTFQDVATIEVERDRNNNVQVQVVGNTYLYGSNYIYEPVYVHRPIIWDVFWMSSYRPYYSPWYWDYYPTYYSYWAPYPMYRYRNNVHIHINNYNTYNYVDTRRSTRAVAMHNTRRANAYERANPNNNFTRRTNAPNRYALEQTRATAGGTRSQGTAPVRNGSQTTRSTAGNTRNSVQADNTRSLNNVRSAGTRPTKSMDSDAIYNSSTRNQSINTPGRSTDAVRTQSSSIPSRQNDAIRTQSSSPSRQNDMIRTQSPSRSLESTPVRSNTPSPVRSNPAPAVRSQAPATRSFEPSRSAAPTMRSASPAPQRQSAPAPAQRSSNNNGGGRRG